MLAQHGAAAAVGPARQPVRPHKAADAEISGKLGGCLRRRRTAALDPLQPRAVEGNAHRSMPFQARIVGMWLNSEVR